MGHLKKLCFCSVFIFLLFGIFSGYAYADISQAGIVTGNGVNLRYGPGLSQDAIDTLPKAERVIIISVGKYWYQVKTSGGETGWIYKTYVDVTKTTTSRGETDGSTQRDVSSLGEKIVNYSKSFLGVPYVWGGSSPAGFDCSGFVQYLYNHFGITLERVAASQALEGNKVDKDNLVPGDLVLFDTTRGHDYINHVGLYIGNGKFIQASSGYSQVVISDLTTGFYAETFMTARRIL